MNNEEKYAHERKIAGKTMTTKEMIEYLKLNKLSNGLNKQEDETIAAIIKTLQDHDKLVGVIKDPHLTQDRTMRALLYLVKSGIFIL